MSSGLGLAAASGAINIKSVDGESCGELLIKSGSATRGNSGSFSMSTGLSKYGNAGSV